MDKIASLVLIAKILPKYWNYCQGSMPRSHIAKILLKLDLYNTCECFVLYCMDKKYVDV